MYTALVLQIFDTKHLDVQTENKVDTVVAANCREKTQTRQANTRPVKSFVKKLISESATQLSWHTTHISHVAGSS